MAQLVFRNPNAQSENQSYRRNTYFLRVGGLNSIEVRANTIGGGPMAVTADVRFTLDGTPITAWISSTAGVWRAACDWRTVSPGSHWLSCEDLLGQHVAEGIEVTVDNGGGPVVGEQDIWTGPTNYALRNNVCSVGGVKVRYTPGVGPRPDPLIPRAGTPYATRLPTSSLWVERMAMAVPKDSLARFTDTPGGYVCVKPRQVYAWFDKAGSIAECREHRLRVASRRRSEGQQLRRLQRGRAHSTRGSFRARDDCPRSPAEGRPPDAVPRHCGLGLVGEVLRVA